MKLDPLHKILLFAVVGIASAWYFNVYHHWQKSLHRNANTAIESNAQNLKRFDSIIYVASKIQGQIGDQRLTELRDSVIRIAMARNVLERVSDQAKDSIQFDTIVNP